jgi:hypothetical protein
VVALLDAFKELQALHQSKQTAEVLAVDWTAITARSPHQVTSERSRERSIGVNETKQEQIADHGLDGESEFAPVVILTGTGAETEFGFLRKQMRYEAFDRFH